ncbi:hypothetical protein Dimus_020440, partial [Dionaea muscipula]
YQPPGVGCELGWADLEPVQELLIVGTDRKTEPKAEAVLIDDHYPHLRVKGTISRGWKGELVVRTLESGWERRKFGSFHAGSVISISW